MTRYLLLLVLLLCSGFCAADMLQKPVGHTYATYDGEQPRAPEQRLHLILLGVKDVQRSAAFYRALGWQVSPASSEGFIKIDLGGYALALLSAEAFSSEVFGVLPPETQPLYNGVALAYLAKTPEEVPEILARAIEAGATLVKPVTRTPWGINAFFKDPDGILLEIDYEKVWVFDAEHRLVVDEMGGDEN